LINALANDAIKGKKEKGTGRRKERETVRGDPESDPLENHAKVPIIISVPFCSLSIGPRISLTRLSLRIHPIFSDED